MGIDFNPDAGKKPNQTRNEDRSKLNGKKGLDALKKALPNALSGDMDPDSVIEKFFKFPGEVPTQQLRDALHQKAHEPIIEPENYEEDDEIIYGEDVPPEK